MGTPQPASQGDKARAGSGLLLPCSPSLHDVPRRGTQWPAELPPEQGQGQSSVPRLRSTALVAAVAGKAETAKGGLWVTENRPSAGAGWEVHPPGSTYCHNTEATGAQLRLM